MRNETPTVQAAYTVRRSAVRHIRRLLLNPTSCNALARDTRLGEWLWLFGTAMFWSGYYSGGASAATVTGDAESAEVYETASRCLDWVATYARRRLHKANPRW